jgi:hypothetical protein
MTDTAAGGCLCGSVRFRVSGRPIRVELCHCATCRRATGAAFAAYALFPADRFRLDRGKTRGVVTSPEIERHGCSACGSPLFNRFAGSGDVDLHLGSFDRPEGFDPTGDIWTERRLAWLPPLSRASG